MYPIDVLKKFLYRIKNFFRERFYTLLYQPMIFRILIRIFKRVAVEGYKSDQCLEKGYLPMPVHFHSPIPDLEDLEKRKIWDKKSKLFGIDFNIKNQLVFLRKLGKSFGKECVWPLKSTANLGDFYLNNPCFGYGCAAMLHSMIREFRPKNVIEIGSGHSSQVIGKALELNRSQTQKKSQYIIIDPYPSQFIIEKAVAHQKLIKKRVEELEPAFFDKLGKDDILFIDSSHAVRIGGDVNFLFLDVLPRIKQGVLVHFHDICLPYEYPKVYATSEFFRQFWTEQYLLQSFLAFNNNFEIMLAANFLMCDHPGDFKKAFPAYNPKIHPFKSGSFWIRRIK